jgi:hypothetical protein
MSVNLARPHKKLHVPHTFMRVYLECTGGPPSNLMDFSSRHLGLSGTKVYNRKKGVLRSSDVKVF